MKSLLLLYFLPLAVFGQSEVNQKTKVAEQKETAKTVTARVLQIQGMNKAGRPLAGNGDFYLEYGGKQYFVKFSESKIKKAVLNRFIGKKMKFQVLEREGLWDTDDPEVQSRIGWYVVILSMDDR